MAGCGDVTDWQGRDGIRKDTGHVTLRDMTELEGRDKIEGRDKVEGRGAIERRG